MLSIVILTACTQGGAGDHPPADWSKPLLINAEAVRSIAAAKRRLPFPPVASPELVSKARIFVRAGPPRVGRALDLMVYDPRYGRLQVLEELSQTTQAELESLANCNHSKGCEGSWDLVTIRNGIRALVVTGPGSTFIAWLDHGVRFTVEGPPAILTRDEAITIANTL
jgi:hypothetical protein